MIKLVYVVRRRPDITPEDFSKYWLEKHGPLARSLAGDLQARKYIQSHSIEPGLNAQLAQTRGMGEAFDGITELWWDNLEVFVSALTSPKGQAASQTLAEDESRFIDLAGSYLFLTEEHVIFDH